MEHIRNAIRADQELLIQKQIQLLHAKNNQELRDQIEAEVEDIQERLEDLRQLQIHNQDQQLPQPTEPEELSDGSGNNEDNTLLKLQRPKSQDSILNSKTTCHTAKTKDQVRPSQVQR